MTTYFQLPAGYCPITGWTLHKTGRLANRDKEQKRKKYHEGKKKIKALAQ